jgi:hypothetical protein
MRNRITHFLDYPKDVDQRLQRAIVDREYVLAISAILGYVPTRLAPMLLTANHILRTFKSPK